MAERRSLMEGLKTAAPADNAAENAFVYNKKPEAAPPASPSVTLNRVPISTRMREDFAKALKRASLERQLDGTEPNTLQDILEAAIEPWLKGNGYLS
jgi:hypothetical protein